ncbi:MAG: hypothetical protein P8Y63_12095 [Deltaproteobacteria bacterium]|jgi:hypothetical protein
MGKIRHLRLCRPEERETGLGREELAVLLGEQEPEGKTAHAKMQRRKKSKRYQRKKH